MKQGLKRVGRLFAETNRVYDASAASFLGGAIAFQAILSLAPLAVVALAVTGLVFGADAARGELEANLVQTLGQAGARTVGDLIDATSAQRAGWIASVLATAAMLIGATSLFNQLQDALNLVWGVKPRVHAGVRGYARYVLRKRVLSFGFVMLVGAALIALLVTKTTLSALTVIPFGQDPLAAQIGELLLSCALGTTLFALLFRHLPDAFTAWRHVIIGAFATAVAVSLASLALGFYLSHVGAQSTYGAAGALTAILLWALVCAQTFFWGACFTVGHCRVFGRGVAPEPFAAIDPETAAAAPAPAPQEG